MRPGRRVTAPSASGPMPPASIRGRSVQIRDPRAMDLASHAGSAGSPAAHAQSAAILRHCLRRIADVAAQIQ